MLRSRTTLLVAALAIALAALVLGFAVLASNLGPRSGRDVYAWFPDGRVERVSPVDGRYSHACVRPQGTQVVYYGGPFALGSGEIAGEDRIWRAERSASWPCSSWPCSRWPCSRWPCSRWLGTGGGGDE